MKIDTPKVLRTDKLSVQLENGFLRYIKWDGKEVLRMVYYTVRDENWDVIPQEIESIEINEIDEGFKVELNVKTVHPQIDFLWRCKIVARGSELTFDIQGEALSNFTRNRIGLCILHPIETCKGKTVTLTHGNGTTSHNHFPKHISPNQPFQNISTMHWELGKVTVNLQFKGDVFETEDQRNWLDASYKTYCTPLELPFPVLMKNGDKIHQTVRLSISSEDDVHGISKKDTYQLRLGDKYFQLPLLGLEANTEYLGAYSLEKLKSLPLNHLRVEIRLSQSDWRLRLNQRLQQSRLLRLPIELVVYPYKNNHRKLLCFPWQGLQISSIIILSEKEKVISRSNLKNPLNDFRKAFPNISIGTGTDFFFTELNRNRPDTEGLDFLSFSSNAQIHASDDLSIIETAQTYTDVLATAHTFAQGLPIHISPVTLKPRSNPNATVSISLEQQRLNRIDIRQTKPLTALWFLTSLKHLAQDKATQVTFFQTLGEEGVLMADRRFAFTDFSIKENELFPIFHAMELLGRYSNWKLLQCTSSHPLLFEGLVFEKNQKREAILLNFTNKAIRLQVEGESFVVSEKEWKVIAIG
ncbi:MAG: hypothetical protein COA50_07540 [Flavobacteriaceae bacterium]|nr:MAG: hypothetical protein COA50_07540 [Flavobacteriaceae bacterium]